MSRIKVEKEYVEENGIPGRECSKKFWGNKEYTMCEVFKEDMDRGKEIETI